MIVAKNKSCIAPFILKMRKTLLTLVFVISNGCVANVLSSRDVENHYNSIVGTKIEPAMYTSKYGWNKINEGTESYEVEMIKKEAKYSFLEKSSDIDGVNWTNLAWNDNGSWFDNENSDHYSIFLVIASKEARNSIVGSENVIFKSYSLGISTNRDEWTYDFSFDKLVEKINLTPETSLMQLFTKKIFSLIFVSKTPLLSTL